MKRRMDAGFSLVEVLVAIALLGAIVVPTCSGLVMSHRMNTKTEEMMHAQLAVSSAVETLMAEGVAKGTDYTERFPDVAITVADAEDGRTYYYKVSVVSKSDDSVSVDTYIRAASAITSEPTQTEVADP